MNGPKKRRAIQPSKMHLCDSAAIDSLGEVTIRASRVPSIAALLLGPFTAFLGGGVLGIWWMVTVENRPLSVVALLTGVAGVGTGLGAAVWGVRQSIMAPSLVLGRDGLQLLPRTGKSILCIPYNNIASIHFQKQEMAIGLTIDLLDANAPGTHLPTGAMPQNAVQIALTWSNFWRFAASPRDIAEAIWIRVVTLRDDAERSRSGKQW